MGSLGKSFELNLKMMRYYNRFFDANTLDHLQTFPKPPALGQYDKEKGESNPL